MVRQIQEAAGPELAAGSDVQDFAVVVVAELLLLRLIEALNQPLLPFVARLLCQLQQEICSLPPR